MGESAEEFFDLGNELEAYRERKRKKQELDPEEQMLHDTCVDFGVEYKLVKDLSKVQASYRGKVYKLRINDTFDEIFDEFLEEHT
ncbi:hypothetical protein JMM81_19430 [Bacillus sp. V3B]|uniref:hypothetical protein n=1 Tax=Bacillus sp. V3B TaxID=2804915 RepID=UPI00210B9251|nr:hypothetical protein [Bacillus sp. V3B]MCQ6277052.1 hypothetical protein [Bacillus sp. V3B]